MIQVKAADLDVIETPGGNASAGLATPSRGAFDVSVIRQRQSPGGANPPHRHDREEVLVILSGAVVTTSGDRRCELDAGDALIIPAGTLHQVQTIGEAPAEWLLIAPAGVRFIHANGEEGSPPWAR